MNLAEVLPNVFPAYAILWIPWIILLVGASRYSRRTRSRAALAMTVGITGYLACAVLAQVWVAAYTYSGLFPSWDTWLYDLEMTHNIDTAVVVNMCLLVVGFVFVAVFAVSFVFVLRSLWRPTEPLPADAHLIGGDVGD